MKAIDFLPTITEKIHNNGDFTWVENPTRSEFIGWLKRFVVPTQKTSWYIRGVKFNEKLYLWNGYIITHHEGCDKLGIPYSKVSEYIVIEGDDYYGQMSFDLKYPYSRNKIVNLLDLAPWIEKVVFETSKSKLKERIIKTPLWKNPQTDMIIIANPTKDEFVNWIKNLKRPEINDVSIRGIYKSKVLYLCDGYKYIHWDMQQSLGINKCEDFIVLDVDLSNEGPFDIVIREGDFGIKERMKWLSDPIFNIKNSQNPFNSLSESPIQNWEIDPQFTQNQDIARSKWTGYHREQDHWSPADNYAINSPKIQKKIFNVFDKVPYNFNFYFFSIPDPDYDKYLERGIVNKTDLISLLGHESEKLVSNLISPDSITVVHTNNLSDDFRISMKSPWALAHRVAHPIIHGIKRSPTSYKITYIFEQFIEQIMASYIWPDGNYTFKFHDDYRIKDEEQEIMFKVFGEIFGTMNSARTKKLVTGQEWLYETLVQYLLQGKVILNPLPDDIDGYKLVPHKRVKAEKVLAAFPTRIGKAFDNLMKSYLGKVIMV